MRKYLREGPGRKQLDTLLRSSSSRSFVVHAMDLLDLSCEKVFESLALSPQTTLETCDEILSEMARELLGPDGGSAPRRLHFRVGAYPVAEFERSTVPKTGDVGLFLTLRGTVIKTGSVTMVETEKTFRCGKCGGVFKVRAEFETFYRIERPGKCPDPDCSSWTPLTPIETDLQSQFCKDYQEIKIQEQVTQKCYLRLFPPLH